MGHRSVSHCVARPQPRSNIAGSRLPIAMHEPQFAATSRMVCKSTHLVFEHSARSLESRRMPVCVFNVVVSCRGLVGKTSKQPRDQADPGTVLDVELHCPRAGCAVTEIRVRVNLPDGIFSGRSATGDGAALFENGRRSDGCRPPTQTSSGRNC